MLLSNPWIKEEITRELRKHFELNDKEYIRLCGMNLMQCLERELQLYMFALDKEKCLKSMI